MKQITNDIMMIKPRSFRYNEQTALNNYYQNILNDLSADEIQQNALNEFNNLSSKLIKAGVNVVVIDDDNLLDTPDSIFPNNWISFHTNKLVCIYPMYAENRRDERREDIIDKLIDEYGFIIDLVKDFTEFEDHNKFLEGTGSMVLDRQNKICYAAISVRTDEKAVMHFCNEFGYKAVCFIANQDFNGMRVPIYHTNVMMCIGNSFSVVCLDTIDSETERQDVIMNLKETGKEIIEISEAQKNRFAGNMLQLMGDKAYIVMSSSAYTSLTLDQICRIEKHGPILHSKLDVIEACGGGSARCMIAEIFLPKEKI